jgi:hypothetical protein
MPIDDRIHQTKNGDRMITDNSQSRVLMKQRKSEEKVYETPKRESIPAIKQENTEGFIAVWPKDGKEEKVSVSAFLQRTENVAIPAYRSKENKKSKKRVRSALYFYDIEAGVDEEDGEEEGEDIGEDLNVDSQRSDVGDYEKDGFLVSSSDEIEEEPGTDHLREMERLANRREKERKKEGKRKNHRSDKKQKKEKKQKKHDSVLTKKPSEFNRIRKQIDPSEQEQTELDREIEKNEAVEKVLEPKKVVLVEPKQLHSNVEIQQSDMKRKRDEPVSQVPENNPDENPNLSHPKKTRKVKETKEEKRQRREKKLLRRQKREEQNRISSTQTGINHQQSGIASRSNLASSFERGESDAILITGYPKENWMEYNLLAEKCESDINERSVNYPSLNLLFSERRFDTILRVILNQSRRILNPSRKSQMNSDDETNSQSESHNGSVQMEILKSQIENMKSWHEERELDIVHKSRHLTQLYNETGKYFPISEILRAIQSAITFDYDTVTIGNEGDYMCQWTGKSLSIGEEVYAVKISYTTKTKKETKDIQNTLSDLYFYISKAKENEGLYLKQLMLYIHYRWYNRKIACRISDWKEMKGPKGENVTGLERLQEFIDHENIPFINSMLVTHELVESLKKKIMEIRPIK